MLRSPAQPLPWWKRVGVSAPCRNRPRTPARSAAGGSAPAPPWTGSGVILPPPHPPHLRRKPVREPQVLRDHRPHPGPGLRGGRPRQERPRAGATGSDRTEPTSPTPNSEATAAPALSGRPASTGHSWQNHKILRNNPKKSRFGNVSGGILWRHPHD